MDDVDYDRLDGKKRTVVPYKVRVDDTTAALAATQEAGNALLLALGTEREAEAREALTVAQAELEACFATIPLTAMDPDQFEALVADHPPREGTKDEAWDADTLPRATFFACVPAGRPTEWWEAWLKKTCSNAEQVNMFNAAVIANVRMVSPHLPKEWTEILS